jgi:hypothetical protein
MDELNNNSFNEEQGNVVDSQSESESQSTDNSNVETVNADNGEVVTPQQKEKPVQSAEENAKFAAVRREAETKAREKARDELITEMYGSQGITTYAQYQKAIEEQQQKEKMNELLQNNIPEDVAREILEARQLREKYQSEQQIKAEQDRRNNEYKEFFETFPDAKPEEITVETWQKVENGIPLKFAFLEQQYNALKNSIDTTNKNKESAKADIGSIKSNGDAQENYYTQDQVKNMSQSEIRKNLTKINESMKRW